MSDPTDPNVPPTPPPPSSSWNQPPVPPSGPPSGYNPPPAGYPPPGGSVSPGGSVPPPPTPPPPRPGGYGYGPGGFDTGGRTPGSGAIDVGQCISWTVQNYGRHAGVLLALAGVVAGFQFIGQLALEGLADDAAWGLASLVSLLVTLGSTVLGVGVQRAALRATLGQTPSFSDLTTGPNLGAYVAASVVVAILTTAGFLLLVIPGFVVMFLFVFTPVHALDTGASVGDALSRSYEIVKANLGPTLLLAIVAVAAQLVIGIVGGILDVAFATAFAAAIVQLVILPFRALLIASAYRQGNGQHLVG